MDELKQSLVNRERLGITQAFCLPQERTFPTTWVEVSKRALIHNVNQYRSLILSTTFCIPIIKSNAYGHGLVPVGLVLNEHPGVDALGVVAISEALELRAAGISKRILVLGIIDAPLRAIVDLDLDLVVYDYEVIRELDAYACAVGKKAKVHLKVDTGLSRFGLLPDDAYACAHEIKRRRGLEFVGISTHFANSESAAESFLNLQLTRFEHLIARLAKDGINPPLKHSSCSAAVSAYTKTHYTAVRFGIGIYGLWPSDENKLVTQARVPSFELQPVLSWKTSIAQLKMIPAGSYVGYNLTHQVSKDSLIAVLPVGYWDGLDRSLSNKGSVIIRGIPAPIVGIIAMNLCMVDVSHITGVKPADEVILIGAHEAVSPERIAQLSGTINYEVVTRINPLTKRMIIE
jgi:alanine racemase